MTAVIILGTRLIGPADLYEKDQPKTIAYTADMVVNGRFALPRDVIYQSATKPPMYNWIDFAIVKTTGIFSEFTLKLPSVLGVILTSGFIYWFCRNAFPGSHGIWLGLFAAAIWWSFGLDIRHGSVIRLSYLARPDMLQCAFLTGAWLFAALAINRERSFYYPIIFWICVTCAVLTKGPAAIMVMVFATIFALIGSSRLKRISNLRFEIGIPLVIVCAGAWLGCAYLQNPEHVVNTILKAEVGARVLDKSPENISKPVYYTAMWFVTKGLPWSLIAIAGLVIWFCYRKLDRALLPAALWMVVAILLLSLPAGKRIDYLLPIYPPAAVMAAYGLAKLCGKRLSIALPILPVLMAGLLSYSFLGKFHETKSHDSDRAIAFVNQVKQIVGNDSVIVINRGKHPITTLLGRHQGSYLTRDDLMAAKWIIIPQQREIQAEIISEALPTGFETVENRPHEPLGLYRNGAAGLSIDRLIELLKAAGEWKIEDNPYHEPGTVWRGETP